MNKSSQNLLVTFVTGVGLGIWAGLEYARVNRKARSPFNHPRATNPWRSSDEDEELQEWLASLKGKSLEELKEVQMDLLYEVNAHQKELALSRIISKMLHENRFKEMEKEHKSFRERFTDEI